MCRPRSLDAASLLLVLTASPLAAGDGDLDPTFGGGTGKFIWTDGGSVKVAEAAEAPSGSIFAVGTIELEGEEPALHWKGVNSAGVFQDQGCAVASTSLFTLATGGSEGRAALVDSTGNLVVGGWGAFSGTEDVRRALVARFELSVPGCALDEDFSSNGWQIFDDEADDPCDADDCEVVDLVEIRPETGAVLAPRIVALVRSPTSIASARFRLLGLTSAGAKDSGFGSGGWVEVTDPSPAVGVLYPEARLAVDAAGWLYVHGARFDPVGTLDIDSVIFRFAANGALDTSYGNDGGVMTYGDDGDDDANDRIPRDVAISSDGVAVMLHQFDDEFAITWAFFDPDFSHDEETSFLVAARVVTQGNGRIVEVGEPADGADGFTLERRLFDFPVTMAMDDSFGDFGFRSHDLDLGGTNSETARYVGLSGGRILVAGDAANGSGRSGFLLRTQNLHVFADGFEQGTPAYWSGVAGFAFPE